MYRKKKSCACTVNTFNFRDTQTTAIKKITATLRRKKLNALLVHSWDEDDVFARK